ncbi:MAG: glycoside hydrolase family 95 protein [Cyclobacteriaceae bacterium]|nr:glycoside hydrolase family 95 protein [Cyclobacteriaceae bacterium]
MRLILFIVLIFWCITIFAQPDNELKLWYNKPSGNTWENALPIGNGRLGAMVYGNVEEEIIQLNEHTVWSGSPNRNDNHEALAALPELRRLIFEGKQKEAEQLANKVIISKKSHGQMFQPVGSVHLLFADHKNYTNYYRELDIEKAIAKTIYTVEDVTYTRETLASLADRVVVLRLTATKAGSISFVAKGSTPHTRANVQTANGNEVIISGVTSDHEGVAGKIHFKGIIKLKSDGGKIISTDSTLSVNNANTATLYMSIATNFNIYFDISANESERANKYLSNAFAKPYNQIQKAHVAAYQKYFNRVKLNLGTTEAVKLPTDERLKNFRNANDPHFAALYFQYGRYLLISSSQPGGQPANLQGIWNRSMKPAWDSKYTININAEMNYWPAEKTNLSELHEPFLRMVKELAESGKETARMMYGARGWTAHHNTDIWRATGAVDAAFWGAWPMGGGWTSQHLWEHYLYNGDKKFLESVYPILKGAALFYTDFLIEHPTYKWLVINPDMSPENAPAAHQGSSLDVGTTMSNQIVFDAFSTVITAAQILNRDHAFSDSLKQMRDRLPPMQVGKHGQLQEWLEDIDDPNDKHRHISHLYGLFPSNQISPYRTPELYAAARTTLQHRGDVSTGWSMGWKVNWWARLLDGNHAYKLIQDQLTPVGTNEGGGGTYNNLFDAHPPFQIDGNFGCTSGIAEMLMQSTDDAVHLLPALPDVWPTGSITGLRARGGFEIVELKWQESKVIKLVIKSTLGGNLRLRTPNRLDFTGGKQLSVVAENSNPFYQTVTSVQGIKNNAMGPPNNFLPKTFVMDVPTQAGRTYVIVR